MLYGNVMLSTRYSAHTELADRFAGIRETYGLSSGPWCSIPYIPHSRPRRPQW